MPRIATKTLKSGVFEVGCDVHCVDCIEELLNPAMVKYTS